MTFLETEYYGNTIESYLICVGMILGGMLIIRLFRKGILTKLKKWATTTETNFDDYVVSGVERFILPMLNVGVMYFAIKYLNLTEGGTKILASAFAVAFTFYAIRLTTSSLRILLESYARRQEGGEEKVKQLRGIMIVVSLLVWSLGLVFLFDNLGYDVTAIITGLGIGGLAVALAAQTILGDLFNYFVIFFDRPFEIGDFIVVDDKRGNVEYVGIKTTRIKSISGEQIVISNSDLTNSRVHNFKRMEKRRIVFTLGVTYQTTPEQLREIPEIVKKIITDQTDAEIDRCHFATFGDFSLNFETVYFVTEPDYVKYMDIQQAINLRIYEEFAARNIEFAYPTQTLFLEKSES
ncbi:MAG: mechanosensitive ion channel family protein [Cyclobacteriaceae bacterium]|nr:mechanosensitive ion channel family protein [Cyclobacteriaceae bacterium]